MTRFSADDVIAGLKDFQRASVEHAFRRLYLDDDSTRRFLVADETGLGKTMVAKGVIARTIERLQDDDEIARIDIVYVCSNADIAEQNLSKLTVVGDHRAQPATRLTMLVAQPDLLASSAVGPKPVTFVSFTPATSFELGWQTGKAEERAILFLLVNEHLGLRRADSTALQRIFQGGVKTRRNFQGYIDRVAGPDGPHWERSIRREFLRSFDRTKLHETVGALVAEVRGAAALTREQQSRATEIIVALRRVLARASVHALEPDLVILDEFQRFKGLLTPGNEAAELAHNLFDQPAARVLLLSATPYKPFTLVEEAAAGEDHYDDLFATLDFLAGGDGSVDEIRTGLAAFRDAALAGNTVGGERNDLEDALLRLLSRVERPQQAGDRTRTRTDAPDVRAEDIAGFVALHRLAAEVEAPVTVEYWKSAPYFANFLDGYKVGAQLKDAMKDPTRRHDVRSLLASTQRIRRRQVDHFEPIEWGNARLRHLASETVDRGWWRLLWVPPSLPYHEPAGPFASPGIAGLTKRLVFSSWVAAPSAIASLLSYETERQIREASGRIGVDTFTPRLQYRLAGDHPAAMSTLALFWPSPTLAAACDPRDAARRAAPEVLSVESLERWAHEVAERLVGSTETTSTGGSAAWHWAAVVGLDARTRLAGDLADSPVAVVDALLGTSPDEAAESADVPRALSLHVAEALRVLGGSTPDGARPSDLADVVALLGLAGPGNVAWRALRRLIPAAAAVTDLGHWKAAAVLASGFRALFNRPDATGLLDALGASDDETYWLNVLGYCRDGNVQAVVDEYLHHLAGAEGIEPDSDAELLRLATSARRALAIRGATYRAVDTDHPEHLGIPFFGRFALRYGGIRQEQDDVRLPEVRAAFNSPFWPFVLATTSIGQEGVDLHWWCHAIVHWNLPSNPVDFEQREGRVDRFKGHAIRKNVAAAHGATAISDTRPDVWEALFDAAEQDPDDGLGDMSPYWMYAGDAAVERSVLGFPMSRDQPAWERLKDVLTLYRLAYGQPRQEDMVELLRRRGVTAADVDTLRLRLDPRRS